ncbi:AAA family ATPase, partial [Vibrio sp. 10N.222.55.E8]
MQGLTKLLVVDDNAQYRHNLSTILEFVGESCEVVSSEQAHKVDWSLPWAGCIVGSVKSNDFNTLLNEKLVHASHIPLLVISHNHHQVDELTNFVGELELPLNYPQLSDALR